MKKKWAARITIPLIIIIIAGGIFLIYNQKKEAPMDIARCIGKNSQVYVQLGCHACEKQKDLFGGSYQYINIVDCFYEREKCINANITATPTWIIKGEKYVGVQSLEKLQELTGC